MERLPSSQATLVSFLLFASTSLPLRVKMRAPFGVSSTTSLLSRKIAMSVWARNASTSLARNLVLSPMPTTRGASYLAPISRSGLSLKSATNAYCPRIIFAAASVALTGSLSFSYSSSIRWAMTSLSV